MVRGGGLEGRSSYDPFVYYGAAAAFTTGHLPYRDFLLLHPPGILLVLAPFALLGAVAGDPTGMAAARLAFMAMGGASAALIYVVLRRRRVAAVTGALLYAVWFPAFYVERDVRLEAVATVLLLLSLVVVERLGDVRHRLRWAAIAGALVGFTVVVKVWGVLPVAVVVVWLALRHGLRVAAAALAGAAGIVVAVVAPFLAAAPNLFAMVVLDQVGRPRSPLPWQHRLQAILGLGPVPQESVLPWLVVAGCLTLVALVLGLLSRQGRLHVALALAGGVALFAAPAWYPHYAAFVAAPLCLLYGNAAGIMIGWVRSQRLRLTATSALVMGLVAAQAVLLGQTAGGRFPGRELAGILRDSPGCVTSDRTAALVLTDTLRRNIARGCPIVIDILGFKFIGQAADPSPAAAARRFQTLLVDYLADGNSAVLVSLQPQDFAPELRARVASWQLVGSVGRYQVRRPG